MGPRLALGVDGGEKIGEQGGAIGLVVVGCVVALAVQDGDELRAGLEEAAAFADGLELAVVSPLTSRDRIRVLSDRI